MTDPLPPISQHVKLTPTERAALGKEARRRAPRSSHGEWTPPPDRRDPLSLLEEQATERVPELVPLRHARMLTSPFAYYRGAALPMASDLAGTPASGLRAQLCGDAHLMNFGLFESPERRLMFDINDFDETAPGPWEWDLKRLATSFEVAGRGRGFSPDARRLIVTACARVYRETMVAMAEKRAIDVWYSSLSAETIREQCASLDEADARLVDRDLAHAEGKHSVRALTRLTVATDAQLRFRSQPPLLVPADELLAGEERANYASAVEMAIASYRTSLSPSHRPLLDHYRFRDMARKVVGVGSVGTRAWVMLFTGRDDDDPLFLQAKQAMPSVLERYCGASAYRNCGRRVVEGQRLMQGASDSLLGWYHVVGFDGLPHDFYMRQLWDGKGAFSVEAMSETTWPSYAYICAWTLARAHARTGDRIAIASYLGTGDVFDRAIADFAAAYADQNQLDYEALREAVASGRLTADSPEDGGAVGDAAGKPKRRVPRKPARRTGTKAVRKGSRA